MNEFYIITVLMIYVLLVLSETLLEYSHVLTDRIDVEDKIIYPHQTFIRIIHKVITPIILRINLKKDYRLNMKRRPPIILVAH